MTRHNDTANSLSEMARKLGSSGSFVEGLEESLAKTQIVDHLLALRGARGFSQKDIAKRAGCTQSKISKFESSSDDSLRLEDLRRYADALNLDLGIFLADKSLGPIGRIKAHAFEILKELEYLVHLAGDDKVMAEGVANAHLEVLLNLVKLVCRSAEKLPSNGSGQDQSVLFNSQTIPVEIRLRQDAAALT